MSSSYPSPDSKPTWLLLARSFAFRPNARFTGLLDPSFFQSLADRHHLHFGAGSQDTFNPPVTTWAWLTQVINPAKSCLAAVARVLVLCVSLGRPLPAAGSGAFCKARAKLPVPFLRDLTCQLGQRLEQAVPDPWLWRGRHHVKIADGSLLQVPDTPANLAQYPQQRSQKPGTSPTCMRLVVLLSLASGGLLGAADGPYRGQHSGELSLLGRLLERVGPDDVLVADAAYCCFALLALLRTRQAHGLVHLHTGRHRPNLTEDSEQTWHKPAERPEWIDEETWAELPEQLTVRLLRVVVKQRGFRPKVLHLATTLCDVAAYPKEEVAALYRDRWQGELDLRSLKQTLGVKLLRCQTPEMVRAELWAHFLGYNLVRTVTAQAAWDKGYQPRQLSFSGAVRTLDEFRWLLCCGEQGAEELGRVLALALATHRVGQRPDRYEPREIKHRQRKYPELSKGRGERRRELAEGDDEAERPPEKNRHSRH